MTYTKLRPMLYTNELKSTIDFYVHKIGFECTMYKEELGWASLKNGDIVIMLSHPGDLQPFEKPFFTGAVYLDVNNATELWEKLKDEVKVAYPIQDMPYDMREFGIFDNNGYMLLFGETF